MPTIFSANESSVSVGGQPLDGVVALEYQRRQVRSNVYALGSAERIGMVSGPSAVEARLTVVSSAPALDALGSDESFQVTANLKRGDAALSVDFAECFLTGKEFSLTVGEHGTATYSFTAVRVVEGPPAS